jgi:hypothetical protein
VDDPRQLAQLIKLLRKNGVRRYQNGSFLVEFGDGSLPPRSRGKADLDPLDEDPKDAAHAEEEDLSVDGDGVPAAMRPVM